MNNWLLWLIAGILSLLGGVFALANPVAATLTATVIAGWMFALIGALTVISAFSDKGWGARLMAVVLGLILLILGVNLIGNPFQGTFSLTLIVGILLLVAGCFRMLLAFATENGRVRLVMVLSALISLALGGMILLSWPFSAMVALGVLLAVELISNGVSLIVLSLARKADAPIDTGTIS
ncbi:HdeD family acid-resistance protein [Roseovarius dicentrarchi]|uniref:HdeD family acid-resistance protein n=1 Tax=Roseovarius dicentrarchi TaxID=2250573 RepID=UPI000DE9B8A5|nr:DUF308 domain-containing protein [Roseovarius dicentrarchi]